MGFLAYLFCMSQESQISIAQEVLQKLVAWIRGKLLVSLMVGFLSFAGFRLIGVENAIPLGFLSGALDLIPVFGPVITLIVAGTVSILTGSLWETIYTIIFLIVLQQFEAFYLEPKIIGKSANLNPLLVLGSIVIGSLLFGFIGTILAVPVLIIISVIWNRAQIKKD